MNNIMRKISTVFLCSMLILMGLNIPVSANDSETIAQIFPDENLAIVIAEHLEKNVEDEVTQEELDTIEFFDGNEREIKSIEGIDRLNKLIFLALAGNEIEDLSPFNKHNFPTLEVIMLTGNKIKSILPLTHLSGMNQVFLENNNIEDVSQIRKTPSNGLETNTGTASKLYTLYMSGQEVKTSRYRERTIIDMLPIFDILEAENNFVTLYDADNNGITEEDSNIVKWENIGLDIESLSFEFSNNYMVEGGTWTYSGVKEIKILDPEVTVRYIDEDEVELLANYRNKGEYLGDLYTTVPELIEGYEVVDIIGAETGTYTAEEQIVTYVYREVPVNGTVVTNYLNENNTILQEPTETTGLIGTSYTTIPADIAGFEVKEVIGAEAGLYTATTQEVTYVYKETIIPINGTVVTNYLNENNTILQEATETTGLIGTSYTTSPADIAGFEVKEVIGAETGLYTATTQEVTYVYKATVVPTSGKVVINYLDENNTILQEATETTGLVGTSYVTSPADIAGFEIKEVIGAEAGVYTAATQEVTYVYKAIVVPVSGKVVTNYQNENGTILQEATETTGLVGTPYVTSPADIAGFEIKEVIGAETGDYTVETQEVTYVYKAIVVSASGKVVTNYLAENNTVLQESTETTGLIGTSYTTSPADIAGFEVKEVIGTETGLYTATTQEVTYVYKAIVVPASGKIVTNYLDENNTILQESTETTGLVGTPYVTSPADIAGFEVKQVIGVETGLYTATTQEVTYVYKAIVVPASGKVVTNYLDENNTVLQEATEITGLVGTPYVTSPADIAGFEVKEVIGVETGLYTATTQEVTYVYKKQVKPTTPPVIPDNKPKLPATGEYSLEQLTLATFLILISSTIIYTVKKSIR